MVTYVMFPLRIADVSTRFFIWSPVRLWTDRNSARSNLGDDRVNSTFPSSFRPCCLRTRNWIPLNDNFVLTTFQRIFAEHRLPSSRLYLVSAVCELRQATSSKQSVN
uniref:Uncharacterized protein n=1 Tax=Schistocephalus solidus TaxID=70667 RepID=A0A0X3NU51_SCHSO